MDGIMGKAQTRAQWASWLNSLASWNWFVTLTFSNLVTAPGAHYWFQKFLGKLEAALNGWSPSKPSSSNGWGYTDAQRTFPRIRVQAFAADEYGPRHGRLHVHALIAGVSSIPRYCGARLAPGQWGRSCCAVHFWACGYARVLAFDPARGASFYISKYTVKEAGNWSLHGF